MKIAQSLLEDTRTVAAMRAEDFDLVLRDVASWPTALLAEMLNIPKVDFLPAGVLLPFRGPAWSIPNPVAYVPQVSSTMPPSPVSGLILCTSLHKL